MTVNTAPLEDPPSSPYQTDSTDSDGLARFAVSSGRGYRWDSYGQHLVRIEEDGRIGVASTWWDVGTSPWELGASSYVPGRVGHVYTDRPIYRPGETVYYKAVVRDDDDASYSVPGPGTEVSVTIRDPRRAYVLNTTAEVDEFGTVAGEFVLPGDAATGAYSVSLNCCRGGSTSFSVAEFPHAGVRGRGRDGGGALRRRRDDRDRDGGALLLRRSGRRCGRRVGRAGVPNGDPRRRLRGLLVLRVRLLLPDLGLPRCLAWQRHGAHQCLGRGELRGSRQARAGRRHTVVSPSARR